MLGADYLDSNYEIYVYWIIVQLCVKFQINSDINAICEVINFLMFSRE